MQSNPGYLPKSFLLYRYIRSAKSLLSYSIYCASSSIVCSQQELIFAWKIVGLRNKILSDKNICKRQNACTFFLSKLRLQIGVKHQFSSNKNSTANETKKNWIKEFFDSIEIRSKNNNFSCQKMIQLFRKTHVVHAALLMPRPLPFTGPKMFCAGSIFLSQSQNLTAFSASSKILCWHKKQFY